MNVLSDVMRKMTKTWINECIIGLGVRKKSAQKSGYVSSLWCDDSFRFLVRSDHRMCMGNSRKEVRSGTWKTLRS